MSTVHDLVDHHGNGTDALSLASITQIINQTRYLPARYT